MDKRKIIKARNNKKDEFYTQLIDIENEILNHKDYIKHFDNKIVFCNCDDPEWSNFFNFFKEHFIEFKLKKLISTHYTNQNNNSYKLTIVKNEYSNELVEIKENLIGNGDFRSDECIEILKSSDIVVTNPPFSLLRDYVRTIMKYNKKFILIGNVNRKKKKNGEPYPTHFFYHCNKSKKAGDMLVIIEDNGPKVILIMLSLKKSSLW